ncbi:DUF7312 domain-containing protein [Haladaptatus sp. CMSO5]|uniref:DUF7312 domain-containing protein n=1 Tax=Haladaptatus sp. CMSO5 TaxID=3120514 RepID=UPI002FCE185F
MSDGDWKYELEDLEDPDAEADADSGLTPGSPKPEHIAFVVLGALLAIFALSRLLL